MGLFSTGSEPTTARRLATWIAAVNVAVFIVLNIASQFVPDNLLTSNLFLTSDLSTLRSKPWTILTYSFCQLGIGHLLLNMILLFITGCLIDKKRIASLSPSRFLSIYFISAIAGGTAFVIAAQNENTLIGASAAVMGSTAAFGIACHDLRFVLPFPGPVKISVIVFILLVAGLLTTVDGNPGATIVHATGILTGSIVMVVFTAVARYKSSRRPMKENDAILTEINLKMRTSGFASLNDTERHILVKQSYISPRRDE